MSVGTKIKDERLKRNYTQDYVAELLGISQATYCDIENGRIKLSIDRLLVLCHEWNMNPAHLLDSETLIGIQSNYSSGGETNGIVFNSISHEALVVLVKDIVKEVMKEIRSENT